MMIGSPKESTARRPERRISRHAKLENGFQPRRRASHATIRAWLRPSRIPGMTPARNSAPSDVPVTAE